MKNPPQLESPNDKIIAEYVSKVDATGKYSEGEKALKRLLVCCSNNLALDAVWLKVTVINDFFNAGVIDTWKIANHIVTIPDFDKRLSLGDLELVDEIRKGHGIGRNGEDRDFYSFATKYCATHNPEKYPIFDQYVRKMLIMYKDKDNFAQFMENELRVYKRFVEIIYALKMYYKLTYSIREIDWFLWKYGKEIEIL